VNRAEKEAAVADMNAAWADASCLYLTDYRGLTVEKVNVLRNACREAGVQYQVVKNRLAARAVEGTDKVELLQGFVGPTAVAWSTDDAAVPAKVLSDFADDHEELEIKEAVVDGALLSPDQVAALAKLPSRDALRSQLLSVFTAPMQQIVSVIAAPARDVVGVIDAYAKKLGEEDNG